jgi:hypothetical protein
MQRQQDISSEGKGGPVDRWQWDALGKNVVAALKKNDFDAVYFPTRDRAVDDLLKRIPKKSVVAIGGSVTLHDLGIPEILQKEGWDLITIHEPELSPQEMVKRMRRQLTSDVFLSSVNAITLNGCLVNVDSAGNRVAAMTFGPQKVILVAGINKVCGDIDAAFERIRLWAGPKNNKRVSLIKEKIKLNNPCIQTGLCSDCRSKTRICRVYSITRKKPMFTEVTVMLIGEPLGY